jgi:Lrp/AsnC family transcriptional regulator for asnA, asnC and gidA
MGVEEISYFHQNAVFFIEVDKIKPNPYQPRREFDPNRLNDLADSIRMYGVLQPLVVTRKEIIKDDGGLATEYELIAGERRLRASKIAGLREVPALIRATEDDEKTKLELAIIENLQREDLNAVDRARAFHQLAEEFGFKHTEIAKKVFVSSGTVHVRMKKLEDMGVVKSATLNIDFSKLGYDISAFLGIYLEKSSLYDTVIEKLKGIAEVVSAYYTTGNYSIFAKIICRDTNHLRLVLDKIQKVDGIDRTETLIVLEESINRPISFFDKEK